MQRGRNILEKLVLKMDLATEPLPGQPLVEIVGGHRVLIENHCGVIKYGCNEILAKVSFGCFCICGENLKLLQMTRERLVIGGIIRSVSVDTKE